MYIINEHTKRVFVARWSHIYGVVDVNVETLQVF